MNQDPTIADMRRRIQRWLQHSSARQSAPDTLEGLEADLSTLEKELEALFPSGQSTSDGFTGLREQAVLRTVLESMLEGVIVADMAGRMLIFNQAARRLLGQDATDAGPDKWSQIYGLFRADGETPYPSDELPLSRALRGETVHNDEVVIRTPTRPDNRHVSASGRALHSATGEQIGALVVFHDITDTQRVFSELRRARATAEENARAKSEFLANISHEIRTPLTAVLGFAELLLDSRLSESDRLNYIQAVQRNGEHLLALINDVLDLSKIQANRIIVEHVECSLHQLVHEVASVMQVRAFGKGLSFRVDYETPIPINVRTDPMRLRQILLNLLSNAIKFTHQGGVTLAVRCLDPETDAARVEFAVRDTGIGLRTDQIEELFQPFSQANPSTTRQYGGTGLGLTICRSLAEALDGSIRVESQPNAGSTFTLVLRLPIDADTAWVDDLYADPEALEPHTGAPPTPELSGHILLAEDGIDNQLLISTILRRQGLRVTIVSDGEEAVNRALMAQHSDQPFDLILMDMQMPVLDGYGATAKLRNKGYGGPVVALTAHAMAGERERCLHAGCDDYLTKPIARGMLLAQVAAHLGHSQMGDEDQERPATSGPAAHREAPPALYSHYADDPDMRDLVIEFVDRLPALLRDIRAAAEAGNRRQLKRLAHQLKGAAGGYGFTPVSEQAAAVESATKDAASMWTLDQAVRQLEATCARVRSH